MLMPTTTMMTMMTMMTTAKDKSLGLAKQFHLYKSKAPEPIQCAAPIPSIFTVQVCILSSLVTRIPSLIFPNTLSGGSTSACKLNTVDVELDSKETESLRTHCTPCATLPHVPPTSRRHLVTQHHLEEASCDLNTFTVELRRLLNAAKQKAITMTPRRGKLLNTATHPYLHLHTACWSTPTGGENNER